MTHLPPRTLVVATLITVAALALIGVVDRVATPRRGADGHAAATASYGGSDRCASCHKRVSPDIVAQFASSAMAMSGVRCLDCHGVERGDPLGVEHEGFLIAAVPTPRHCASCHPSEVRQFENSRHGGPAWMALSGLDDFTPGQRLLVEQIPEANRAADGSLVNAHNSLFDIEGPTATRGACQSCHSIGRPNRDGSVGNCNKCHLRHEFSVAQARRPEVCGRCHIGPDHPHLEIYEESAHGVLYEAQADRWNWEQKPGRLTVADMPAPTCATCHMSGFGTQATTHDVGQRLSKYLFAAVTTDRPNAAAGREAMRGVCTSCHSTALVDRHYAVADSLTTLVNGQVARANALMQSLVRDGLVPAKPFGALVSFEAFDLWHYYGRTAKFGAYMQGPDYVQWHGLYPLLKQEALLEEEAGTLRAARAHPKPS